MEWERDCRQNELFDENFTSFGIQNYLPSHLLQQYHYLWPNMYPTTDSQEEFLLHISESFADASTRELGNNHVMHPLQHVNELNILLYESIIPNY